MQRNKLCSIVELNALISLNSAEDPAIAPVGCLVLRMYNTGYLRYGDLKKENRTLPFRYAPIQTSNEL